MQKPNLVFLRKIAEDLHFVCLHFFASFWSFACTCNVDSRVCETMSSEKSAISFQNFTYMPYLYQTLSHNLSIYRSCAFKSRTYDIFITRKFKIFWKKSIEFFLNVRLQYFNKIGINKVTSTKLIKISPNVSITVSKVKNEYIHFRCRHLKGHWHCRLKNNSLKKSLFPGIIQLKFNN